ncbi:MAG: N-methyl-L-tryptophan oxidase [Chloroflexota bacterium]
MKAESYDLIIVGLGAMGSAALYQAAKRGAKVLGIDRYDPPHDFGSSHAETRITRLAVGEGPQYLPLVARSHEIWDELEGRTGEKLFYRSGGYIIGPKNPSDTDDERWGDFVTQTGELAAANSLPHQYLSAAEVRAAHPHILMKDHEHALLEKSGGVVLSELAIAVQIKLARSAGATININEPVLSAKPEGDGVTVTTPKGRYSAAKAILSTGPWITDFLPEETKPIFRVTRQVVYWFEHEQPEILTPERMPFIIWAGETINDYFSSFPMPPGGIPGYKVLTERFIDATNPQDVSREVTAHERDGFYTEIASQRIRGLTPHCVKAAVCLYTSTADDHFVIDSHPDSENILVASPCSGHGFKHSPAIGESLVQKALDGESKIDLSPFAWGRVEQASS